MNRSESEWAFQRFLQEARQGSSPQQSSSAAAAACADTNNDTVVEIKGLHSDRNNKNVADVKGGNKTTGSFNVAASNGVAPSIPVDAEDDYQTILKNKLNLACAAVALYRVRFSLFYSDLLMWVYLVGEKREDNGQSLYLFLCLVAEKTYGENNVIDFYWALFLVCLWFWFVLGEKKRDRIELSKSCVS